MCAPWAVIDRPYSLRLEQSQPVILRACSVTRVDLKTGVSSNALHLFVGETGADPCIRFLFGDRITLHLKFEDRAGAQDTKRVAYITLNDGSTRDVLEHDGRDGEIKMVVRENGKIGAVIQVDLHIRGLPQGSACLGNHLRTDIDG